MNASQDRLQIATRIHFFLKRTSGHGIDVESMLTRAPYAGEVLALCNATPSNELQTLAERFRVATAKANRPPRQHADLPWAGTSGLAAPRREPHFIAGSATHVDAGESVYERSDIGGALLRGAHQAAAATAASPSRSSSPPSAT